jgi:hypothetical protein
MPIIDLRPFTRTRIAASRDPLMAQNAISWGRDDGTGFADAAPRIDRRVDYELRVRIDRVLVDGALFQPSEMEDKWALYLHRGRILCLRSWTRELHVAADVRVEGDLAVIGPLHGTFADTDEPPEHTRRCFEFLLRSHALDELFPAPIVASTDDLTAFATICFSLWGRNASFAAEAPPACSPARPLRTSSLFHIAVARGDRDEAERHLARGVPIDLVASDGLTALHWAIASRDPGMLLWLLDRGAPADARSAEGATSLMNAVQADRADQATLLLDRGADPDARDLRGFTALHRAAEKGHLELARLLLARGADPGLAAFGHTARSFAEARGHEEIVKLLS